MSSSSQPSRGGGRPSDGIKDYPGPRGAPTLSYAAVDKDDGDLTCLTNQTLQLGDRKYEVEEVFGKGSSDDAIYEGMLESEETGVAPLKSFVKRSVSCCALIMGSTTTRKKEIFQGDGNKGTDGMIGWTANKLFELLDDEEDTDDSLYGYTVSVSFVEIFDEVLVDLLNPEDKNLQLLMDPQDGYQVTPLHKEEVRTYDDVMKVLEHGIKNRTTKRLQDGSASKYSCAMWEFHLTQQRRLGGEGFIRDTLIKTKVMDKSDPLETRTSRLVIIETPCTDDLVESPVHLRARYGPNLHKSLFTFMDVCKAMADDTMHNYAPFAQSRLTRILQDILGGNFLVLCLICLSPGELPVSAKAMDMMATLAKASHFPNENNEMLQGLLIKYRNELGYMNDRLLEKEALDIQSKASGGAKRVGGSTDNAPSSLSNKVDDAELQHQFHKMEQDLLQASLERNQAREDACKIFKVLELLKEKYNTVLEDKAKQAKELIEVEEAKLKIARSLLELKLEMSKVQEKFETEKYDMTSQLLAVKNELCELEIKLHEAEQTAQESKEQADKAKREKEDMQVELGTLHANFTSLRKKYKEEESRTMELGAELLSLVNAQEILGKSKAELEVTAQQQFQKLKDAEQALEKSLVEQERLGSSLREQTRQLEHVRAEKIKAELELERAKVGLEQSRLQLDKNTADVIREKEVEVLQARRGIEGELRQLQALNDTLTHSVATAEGQMRKENRRAEDLGLDLQRMEEEMRALKKERDTLESSLVMATNNYRQKVTASLEKSMRSVSKDKDQPNSNHGLSGAAAADKRNGPQRATPAIADARVSGGASSKLDNSADRTPLEDLIENYKSRERTIISQLNDLRIRSQQVSRKNQVLFDKARRLHHIAEDFAPTVLKESGITLLDDEETDFEKEMKDEAESLRHKVANMERELSVSQEKNLQLAELYTEAVKDLEQVKLEMGKMEAANNLLRKQQMDDNPTIKKLEEMQQALLTNLSQIKERSSQVPPAGLPALAVPALSDAAGAEEGCRLKQENDQLRKQLLLADRLQQQQQASARCRAGMPSLDPFRPETGQAWAPPPGSGGNGVSKQGGISLMAQVHEAEKRYANLMSKCAMLEEESSNYKKHMQSVIGRYQSELRRYKQGGPMEISRPDQVNR